MHNPEVKARLEKITAVDSQRQQPYAAVQRARFNLPAWPTTTIGSFPQTTEIRGLRLDFKRGRLDGGRYHTGISEHIKSSKPLSSRSAWGWMCWYTAKPNAMTWWSILASI